MVRVVKVRVDIFRSRGSLRLVSAAHNLSTRVTKASQILKMDYGGYGGGGGGGGRGRGGVCTIFARSNLIPHSNFFVLSHCH